MKLTFKTIATSAAFLGGAGASIYYTTSNSAASTFQQTEAPIEDGTYKIRYKGLRCIQSQEEKGDEISVYLSAINADTDFKSRSKLETESPITYENVKNGHIEEDLGTLFKGKDDEEFALACAITERDKEENQNKSSTLKRVGQFIKKIFNGAEKVSILIPTKNKEEAGNNTNQVAGTGASSSSTRTNNLKKAETAADILENSLDGYFTMKLDKDDVLLQTVKASFDKDKIQEYLRSPLKKVENEAEGKAINYHFSKHIKKGAVDYELFFDFIGNK